MTDKDKEAVNLLMETLETYNVKVIQVILYELLGLEKTAGKNWKLGTL